MRIVFVFFFQAEDGIRDKLVTGVQTCALPIFLAPEHATSRVAAPKDASMISASQAADLIGISRAAVYKAIEKGALNAIRLGNVTVVDRASALAYRDERRSDRRREPR